MAPDIQRIAWNIQHGAGYLLCYDMPFGKPRAGKDPELAKFSTASHYLGISDERLPGRLTDHEKGHGAKLTRHVRAAGIGWELVRVWEDCNRSQERRLKEPGAGHWCPRCPAEAIMSRDPVYAEVMAQARATFVTALAAARAQRLATRSESAGTRLWNQATRVAQAEFRAARRDAAASWAAEHPGTRLRKATLRCVLQGQPVVSSLSARRAAPEASATTATHPAPASQDADPGDPWSWGPAEDQPLAAALAPRGPAEQLTDPDDPWSWPLPAGEPSFEAV